MVIFLQNNFKKYIFIIKNIMGQLDSNVFGDKTFSDILEEIYNNQKKRDAQVVALISELKPLVQEIGDATLIVPLIKEYMEIGVKNDEALIKMATIVQRALQNVDDDGGLGISDEEKEQLLAEMEKLNINKEKDA
jgi:transcriptional regulator